MVVGVGVSVGRGVLDGKSVDVGVGVSVITRVGVNVESIIRPELHALIPTTIAINAQKEKRLMTFLLGL